MTWITNDKGTYWVEVPPRKRRESPHVPTGRFKDIKVGDWLVKRWKAFDSERTVARFYLVQHAWFDPVEGQRNPMQGQLFAIALLRGLHKETGEVVFSDLEKHTRRGLASQGFHYADHDPAERLKATATALADGTVLRLAKPKRRAWLPPAL